VTCKVGHDNTFERTDSVEPYKPLRLYDGEVKRRRLIARQQVGVAGQREGGRVVAEGAAQLEEVGALAEVERGEGMAERVEAGPGGVDLLYERLEDAAAEIAGLSGPPASLGNASAVES
jgi:hypothetical protein